MKKKIEKGLRNKIDELFVYRKIPFLLSFLEKKKEKELSDKLVMLQVSIYELDAYLESNWKLKEKALKKKWKFIFQSMADIGITGETAIDLLSHIRRYQKHEVQLRSGLMPMRMNMEYYYHYKSCDVRLMREIIYSQEETIENHIPIKAWRYFDIITEVNDDVEDVFEDQQTINGNMFLLSILQDGYPDTQRVFQKFLNDIYTKSQKTTYDGIKVADLSKWSRTNFLSTMELLEKNLELVRKQKKKVTSPVLTR